MRTFHCKTRQESVCARAINTVHSLIGQPSAVWGTRAAFITSLLVCVRACLSVSLSLSLPPSPPLLVEATGSCKFRLVSHRFLCREKNIRCTGMRSKSTTS